MTEPTARRIFNQELRAFTVAFPSCAKVRLVIRARHFEPASKLTDRDLAWFDDDAKTVCLLRKALKRSAGSIRGIIRHELGHACDPSWEPGEEKRADDIAREVCGSPIRYTKDGVQHATHGNPKRPSELHQ